MPAYDSTQFSPPAPMARVSLRTSQKSAVVDDVPMLIDSGADLTLVPERFALELGLELDQSDSYELEGFDGRKTKARSAQLELVFLRRTFKGRFVVINSECGFLGRNVLNHFVLTLDGPQLNWQEQNASAR
jgi:hypothetical protein